MCGFAVYTGSDMMDKLLFASEFKKIEYRGPDNSNIRDFGDDGWMGFHRLSIMDISSNGNQPLTYKNINLVCNGEVYNFQQLRRKYEHSFEFQSSSDCEVIIPLFLDKGIEETAKSLVMLNLYLLSMIQLPKNILQLEILSVSVLYFTVTLQADKLCFRVK